jgi:hypothetical protein
MNDSQSFFAANGQHLLHDALNLTTEQIENAVATIRAYCPNDAEEIIQMIGVFV